MHKFSFGLFACASGHIYVILGIDRSWALSIFYYISIITFLFYSFTESVCCLINKDWLTWMFLGTQLLFMTARMWVRQVVMWALLEPRASSWVGDVGNASRPTWCRKASAGKIILRYKIQKRPTLGIWASAGKIILRYKMQNDRP